MKASMITILIFASAVLALPAEASFFDTAEERGSYRPDSSTFPDYPRPRGSGGIFFDRYERGSLGSLYPSPRSSGSGASFFGSYRTTNSARSYGNDYAVPRNPLNRRDPSLFPKP